MITKAMRQSQKGWSVCSTLGWSLQGQSYMISCKIAWGSPGGASAEGSVRTRQRRRTEHWWCFLCFLVDIIFCICYPFLFNIVYFFCTLYDTPILIPILILISISIPIPIPITKMMNSLHRNEIKIINF